MNNKFEVVDKKDALSRIPVISIENNCSPDISAQNSPLFGQKPQSFVSDTDLLSERSLPNDLQAMQFAFWFNELTPSKQFLFTALSLQHIRSDYLKLIHSVSTERLAEDNQHMYIAPKAKNIVHLDNLDDTSDDFCATILDLLSALDVPKERDDNFFKLRDKYLLLVGKALENALQQKLILEDVFDSLEGQLLIVAMTTPLFTLEDRHWLRKYIQSCCDACSSWQSTGLLSLAKDILEALEFQKGSDGFLTPSRTFLPRNVRISSLNSPFLSRSLNPYLRHHSLIPPTNENSLIVPSSFASSQPLSSSSSLNSSGFVSGSESMYQGLNDRLAVGFRGNRLAAPSNSKLYLLRRQSVSPYTPQEGELIEEDDIVSTTACSSTLPGKCGSYNSSIVPRKDQTLITAESFEGICCPQEYLIPPMPQKNPDIHCMSVTSPFSYNFSPTIGPMSGFPLPKSYDDANEPASLPDDYKKSQICHRPVLSVDEQIEDPDMAQVPVWLKSLRLHKYISLFRRLTYYQMLEISEEWLQLQKVTQGARNKILVSIANLRTRSATLNNLEVRMKAAAQSPLLRSSNLRGCLLELRSILYTPFPRATASQTSTSPHCLSTSSVEDSVSAVGALGTSFIFGSDMEDDVEDDGPEDDERVFLDFRSTQGGLCQCPCTNSDTCLLDRSNTPRSTYCLKRSKSSEGRAAAMMTFFPTGPSEKPEVQDPIEIGPKSKYLEAENLPAQIMRCLNFGFKALLCEPIDYDDNYGFFMQLLTVVLDHPSFNQLQKDQMAVWQKHIADRLGPPPPPPRRFHHHHYYHHRAASRRSSYHFTQPQDRGGSHSAPYTPRSSVGHGGFPSQPYIVSPNRLSYLHHQKHQGTSVPSALLQGPFQFSGNSSACWSGGMARGYSAEPDVYHQQQGLSRPAFLEQALLTTTSQQRVASMDSLTVSSSYGLIKPREAPHQFFAFNEIICPVPLASDTSTSVSPFVPQELQSSSCFTFMPTVGGSGVSEGPPAAAAVVYLQPPASPYPEMVEQRHWLASTSPSAMVDFSMAEINRNLDLLTEKVTKLAIDESDSPSE